MSAQVLRACGATTAFVVCSILIICSTRIVPPACIGVVTTFGHVSQGTLSSGLHVVNPFASVIFFSTKTQLLEQQNHVPTKEGLTVDLDVALLFRIEPERVQEMYLSLGENYISVLVAPELSSAVRGLTSEQDAKALYTSGRSEMQKKLKSELETKLSSRGVVLEDVLLKAVTLPNLLTHAIELKAQAEQESARMEFVLTKETQEANRKSIEAKGIADFQR
jgi:regulator of protease activity HflC (stomatin/prohibitin superfamily)